MNEDAFYIFVAGIIFGMILSDYLSRIRYREFVRDIPEFLKDETETKEKP